MLMSAAGRIVESMICNIDVMEQEKRALLRIMDCRPELEPEIRPRVASADEEIARARKKIARYHKIESARTSFSLLNVK